MISIYLLFLPILFLLIIHSLLVSNINHSWQALNIQITLYGNFFFVLFSWYSVIFSKQWSKSGYKHLSSRIPAFDLLSDLQQFFPCWWNSFFIYKTVERFLHSVPRMTTKKSSSQPCLKYRFLYYTPRFCFCSLE